MSDTREEAHVHFTLADGRAFSVSAALIRFDGDATLLRSSLIDVNRRRCATLSIGDARIPALLRARLESSSHEPVVRRALDEILAAGQLPFPDAIAEPSHQMRIRGDGAGELRLSYPDTQIACELALSPGAVTGTLVIAGERHAIAKGVATYARRSGDCDHWAVHLDDGTTVLVDSPNVRVTPLATWTSRTTFHEYAVAWRLQGAELDLELRATFPEQEFVTVTADPSWQGRCEVSGTIAGKPVTGVAFAIQRARDATATLSELFAAIPRETSRVIERQLPIPLRQEHVLPLLGDDVSRYVRDVDLGEFQRILLEPIREIIDRHGKAWRSYTAVLCYHALRGDKWREDIIDVLLGLAEVIHVGSLIVDDVEDASPTRRGGPACHIAHGVPIAINAGTFCYFAWQAWFARLDLPAPVRLQIYEIYFEFMRVAHLGQALDIQGFTRAMAEEIVATGDVTLVERQMKNVYMLKTGAPASVFARIGAIVAGGQEAQVRALSNLFEALGISFQIMDDVNNLKGFQGDPKHCEDLAQAKVTMPVLEAMRVLDLAARRDLWDRIGRCGHDPSLVPSIIETLDASGAFTACRDQAHRILEDAWRAADPHLSNSFAKVMLHAFCLHIVESLG